MLHKRRGFPFWRVRTETSMGPVRAPEIISSNLFKWFPHTHTLTSTHSAEDCWPLGSLCSSPLWKSDLHTLATLAFPGSQLFPQLKDITWFFLGFPSSLHNQEPLQAVSWGTQRAHLAYLPALRVHCPSLSDVQRLEKCFMYFLHCFRREGKSGPLLQSWLEVKIPEITFDNDYDKCIIINLVCWTLSCFALSYMGNTS